MRANQALESKKVRGATFARMWKFLESLVVGDKLREVFERKELIVATVKDKDFQSPENLDEFFRWAKGREKIFQEGDSSFLKYRAVISPIKYFPDEVQPYLRDRSFQKILIDKLVLSEDETRKSILGDDIADVISGFTGVKLNAGKVLIAAELLVKQDLLSKTSEGNNFFIITQSARNLGGAVENKHKAVLVDEPKEGETMTDNVSSEIEANGHNEELKIETVKIVSSVSSEDVVLSEGVPHISAAYLNKLFPIFLKTGAGTFKTDVRALAREFGFATPAILSNNFGHLRKAGWLLSLSRGVGKWDLKKVSPQWVAALKEKKPVQDLSEETVEATEGEEPLVEEVYLDVRVSASKEITSGPSLEEQLAQTKQQLSEQERINYLMAESIAEMLYRQMADIPKEVQVRVLKSLTERIAIV